MTYRTEVGGHRARSSQDDLDPEDSGDFDADDYADLDTEFLDSLLPESPVKSQ